VNSTLGGWYTETICGPKEEADKGSVLSEGTQKARGSLRIRHNRLSDFLLGRQSACSGALVDKSGRGGPKNRDERSSVKREHWCAGVRGNERKAIFVTHLFEKKQ